MSELTSERLRAVLSYDPETGIFRWLQSTGPRAVIGAIAGTIDHKGYRRIRIDGIKEAAHRLAFLHIEGRWPAAQVDHINRNRADNRWDNLREATQTENSRNLLSPRSLSGSGLKGAYPTRGGRWQAIITVDRQTIYLGTFDTESEAHLAYRQMAAIHFGDFARTV